jgi:hypothetical protein
MSHTSENGMFQIAAKTVSKWRLVILVEPLLLHIVKVSSYHGVVLLYQTFSRKSGYFQRSIEIC